MLYKFVISGEGFFMKCSLLLIYTVEMWWLAIIVYLKSLRDF